jgi:hypothetical protein
MHKIARYLIAFLFIGSAIPAFAGDVVTNKNVGMEMARDLASEAVMACRKSGYNVSAVIACNSRTKKRNPVIAHLALGRGKMWRGDGNKPGSLVFRRRCWKHRPRPQTHHR